MTSFPSVQFVAAPEPGAAVLFDFNDEAAVGAKVRVLHDGFSLGTPSVSGDPDGLGVEYGSRTMSFTIEIVGTRGQALATQATLARTFMLRRRGWLRVQFDELATPVWLRTYTPTPGELDFQAIILDRPSDRWQISVQVAAEPFIRGERITLGTWTINNNPAHATNPTSITLPSITGDAPAPLRVTASFSADRGYYDVMWSCAAVPEGFTPVTWQIGASDGFTLGADVGASVSDANMSGGSYRPITFATTPGMVTRLAGVPAGSPPPAGRYRVFLRAARDDTSSVMAFKFGYRTGYGDLFNGSPRVVLDRNQFTWLDLGEFDFPLPRAGADIQQATFMPSIALAVERVSGSGPVFLDAFRLVPVDVAAVSTLEPWEKSDSLVTEFGANGPFAGQPFAWDGDSESFQRIIPGGGVDATVSPSMRGQFLTARPGHTNVLTVLHQVKSGPSAAYPVGESITAAVTATVSYQPRNLWLGEG